MCGGENAINWVGNGKIRKFKLSLAMLNVINQQPEKTGAD